jgi:hypothetical protein
MAVVITNKAVVQMRTVRIKTPHCCGREMSIKTDLGKFLEVNCGICGDVIYIKKQDVSRPQLIDD